MNGRLSKDVYRLQQLAELLMAVIKGSKGEVKKFFLYWYREYFPDNFNKYPHNTFNSN